jgi:hypothetical protein
MRSDRLKKRTGYPAALMVFWALRVERRRDP